MNQILKEQLEMSCQITTAEELFEKVNQLATLEVIGGVLSDGKANIVSLRDKHVVVNGKLSSGRESFSHSIVAQLLLHDVQVYSYDVSYSLPLLLQKNNSLTVCEDLTDLMNTIHKLCKSRVRLLIQQDAISMYAYNVKHTFQPIAPVVVYIRDTTFCDRLIELMAMGRSLGVHFIVDGELGTESYVNKYEFKEKWVATHEGQEIHMGEQDLFYLVSKHFTDNSEKCNYFDKDTHLDILTGKLVL